MSVEADTPSAARFSPRVVVALVLVGIFSLAALTVLSAYAPDLRKGDNGGAHALSRSAVGFAGAARLFDGLGEVVELSRAPLGDHPENLLILTPTPYQNAEALAAIAHSGPRLVVLPKWSATPHPTRPGWITGAQLLAPDIAARAVPREKPADVRLSRRDAAPAAVTLVEPGGERVGRTGPIRNLQTLAGDTLEPLVVDERGAMVLAVERETGVYYLSDPDLLNTQGLKSPDTARTAVSLVNLIWGDDGMVIFDLTLHGFGKPHSVLRSMLEPPLLGATLCLLVATALVAFQAFVRFGPSRRQARAVALGKRALADNTAGLIRLAKREHRMAGPYAILIRAAVARAIAAPRELDGEELDAFLDRLGCQTGASAAYTALAAEARAARTAGDLLKVARNLHRWKLEMTRGRQ